MNEPNLVTMLAGVFGLLAGFMGLLGLFYSPVAFGVAVPFGVSAAVLWYHGSGRLEARIRGSARERTARERTARGRTRRDASAGPRGPNFGDGRRMRGEPGGARGREGFAGAGGGRGAAGDGGAGASGRYAPQGERVGPTRDEALAVLGLEPGASRAEVRSAYREHAKQLHPDRGGDEDAFKRLNRAYDRLQE